MKTLGMLALALTVVLETRGFTQEEPPLEPIPLPAPVAKVPSAEPVATPLDGPVFPEDSVVVEPTAAAPIEVESAIEYPAQPAVPPVFRARPAAQPAAYAPATPAEQRIVPAPQTYAAPGQPVVYEQSYYRSRYQPIRRRIVERASYEVSYPPSAGVAVYRTVPAGVVQTQRVIPATYVVPAPAIGPYAVVRTGYAPAYRPIAPVVAAPYAPVPFVPGQPVRNAIRSMLW